MQITVNWKEGESINEVLHRVEKMMIKTALYQNDSNKTHAAKMLNMKRTTLCMRIRKYHPDIPKLSGHVKLKSPETEI